MIQSVISDKRLLYFEVDTLTNCALSLVNFSHELLSLVTHRRRSEAMLAYCFVGSV